MMNIMNGGKHAAGCHRPARNLWLCPSVQRLFVKGCAGGVEIYQSLKKLLSSRGYRTTVGDEGGFAPRVSANSDAFDLIMEAIEKAGYRPGEDIMLAMDAAASEIYEDGKYHLKTEGKVLTGG